MTQAQALSLRTKMLGALMRKARLASGKSLKEMAALIGTGSGMLSSFENGRRAISLPELELLAYHLNVPLRQFWSSGAVQSREREEFNPGLLISLRQRMIAAQLRIHREAAGLTARQLAERVGMSAERLRLYERGERPIPLPELEILLESLGRSMDEYVEAEGPVGDWASAQRAFEGLLELTPDLREFLSDPVNQPYLRLAKQLSQLSIDRLRDTAELLLDLTL